MFTNFICSLGYLSAFGLNKKYLSSRRQCGHLINSTYHIVSLEEKIHFVFKNSKKKKP